jgi:hypothetical protein
MGKADTGMVDESIALQGDVQRICEENGPADPKARVVSDAVASRSGGDLIERSVGLSGC